MKKALEAAGECCVTLMMGMGSATAAMELAEAPSMLAAAGLVPPQAAIDGFEL